MLMMLAASTADSSGRDMSAIFAPFFWGFFVSIFLGGITIVQAYVYFPHPTDRIGVQVIAATMLILDLISSGLVAQSLYYYLVPHFGSVLPLQTITPELSAECMISGILTFVSQMYFVYQIYSVRRGGLLAWAIIGILTLLAILTFGGGIGCVATMYVFAYGVLADRNKDFAIFFGLAKGFGAVTDIIATIAMSTFLSKARTGMKHTDSLIKHLIQYVVERGAVVTLIQTLLLITFYAAPNRLYWLAFHINVTKLYANTFFCMLNARKNLWDKHAPASSVMLSSVSHNGIEFRGDAEEQRNAISLRTFEKQQRDSSPEMPTITKSVFVA
ncbi:hypothetical protein GYMLUDRAFT_48478 [Collybiopsis luxurians FD-317 M1]|uniref:DUF6534 domain-containing protein n=1 Tax=Collybiopsis luxurians FD-317 M1 TaxID=944289 RepID=A0A0D0BY62_9AGAR|nr:hypothetical protein GYMLUDRAFT_48478 [Collybiopsis luxurians FD-317 M1]